jgi:PAS domain S-box-containing protein
MKIEYKIAIFMSIIVAIVLAPLYLLYYQHNKKQIIDEHIEKINHLSNDVSSYIELQLKNKVNIALTLSSNPCLIEALQDSNNYYTNLSNKDKYIKEQNEKWINVRESEPQIAKDMLDKKISNFLLDQKRVLPNTYGEIFLTNKYGVALASTNILSTYSHSYKNWWKNTYNEGAGSLYFDDRGYDKSANDYVLGVVVPVYHNKEIIGILKCNLMIRGFLYDVVEKFGKYADVSIIRSNGLIVAKEGIKPLSESIDDTISKNLSKLDKNPQTIDDYVISVNGISITKDKKIFGSGKSEIDHLQGNQGEIWYTVVTKKIDSFLYKELKESLAVMLFTIVFIICVLIFVYYYLVKNISKPLEVFINTIKHSNKKYKQVDIKSSIYEIEFLAQTYNKLLIKIETKESEVREKHEQIMKLLSDLEVQRKEQLRQVLNSALDGVQAFRAIRDENNKIVDFEYIFSNNRACEIIGHSQEELIGTTLLQLIPSNDKPLESLDNKSLFQEYVDVVESGEPCELTFYFDNDGIKEWFANKSVKLEDGFVVTFSVITKEIEQKNILATQSRLATMGEMISIIAHQWRQPISAIMGIVANIDDMITFDKIDETKLRNYLSNVEDTLLFMSNTIEDFRNFFNNDKVKQNFNILVSILNTYNIISAQLANHNINISLYVENSENKTKLEFSKDIIHNYHFKITSYPNELQQVLLNILSNAKDALLDNESDKNIDIVIKDNENNYTIDIVDNGKGITEENINRVFEPYFTTKKELQGTGLGLYMSKMIVQDSLGGDITINSKESSGTTVSIRLDKGDV